MLGSGKRLVDGGLVAEMPAEDGVVGRDLVDLRPGSSAPRRRRRPPAAPRNRRRWPRPRPSPAPASRRRRRRRDRRRSAPCLAPAPGAAPAFIGVPSLEWIIQPQISPPTLSAARSSPVSTASTPGFAFAAAVSIERMVACACGERRKVGIGLPRAGEVVDVMPAAGDEALVFLAAHRGADSRRGHGGPSPFLAHRRIGVGMSRAPLRLDSPSADCMSCRHSRRLRDRPLPHRLRRPPRSP